MGVSGIEFKMAAKKGSAWGTAVECGANDGILMLPGSFKKSRKSNIDDSLGLFWPTDSDPGEISADGDRPFYMRYDTLDLLIAMMMGTAGSPTYTSATDTGTAESGGNNTLTDTDKTWTVDANAGKFVTITGGTGAGQTRKITANTATQLTVAANWGTNPDATSTYEISGSISDHIYDLADSVDGLFATIAVNKKINIEEAVSAKIMGMTLKGSVGNPMEVSFKVLAYNIISDSAVNTLVTFANVTYLETENRVLHNQGIFRLNNRDAAALGVSDKIWPSEFELNVERKMSGVYGAGGTFDNIDEPTNDGVPEVKLKLTFPRYSAVTYFTDWDANTPKKLDMTFTGGLIAGASYRTLTISMPHLKYANVEAPEERGIIKNPLEFNSLAVNSAPAGMTGITKPFRLELKNTYGGDPLQAGN